MKIQLGFIFGLLLSSQAVLAEQSTNVALTSDYVWRGVSQSLEDPAIQGGFDWRWENGFSFGVWGSNVDFVDNGQLDDGADMELDFYFNYGIASGKNWSTSIGITRYTYPGTATGIDYDWNELNINVSFYKSWGLSLNLTNDVFGRSENGTYIELSKTWEVNRFNLGAAFGVYQIDESVFSKSNYTTLGLSAETTIDKINVGISYHINDSNTEDIFGDIGKNRLAFTLSHSF